MIFKILVNQALLSTDTWQEPRARYCVVALAVNLSLGLDGELLYATVKDGWLRFHSENSDQVFGMLKLHKVVRDLIAQIDLFPGLSGVETSIFPIEIPDKAWKPIDAEIKAVRRMNAKST